MTEGDSLAALRRAARGTGPWHATVSGRRADVADEELDGIERALAGRPGAVAILSPVSSVVTELALLADVLVCADGARLTGAGGLPPRIAGTPRRLASRLGGGAAIAFWLDPRGWPARKALRVGLVDAVSRDAASRAERLAGVWRASPHAAAGLKLLAERGGGLGSRGARALERALFALVFAGDEARRGARRFLERDRPGGRR